MLEISIEEMKALDTKIASELSKRREPIEELKQVVKMVDQILQEAKFKDAKEEEYFFTGFLGKISKNALNSSHFKSREVTCFIQSVDGEHGEASVHKNDLTLREDPRLGLHTIHSAHQQHPRPHQLLLPRVR
eukprot:TRINITY_DN4291_c0_g1_i3.p1 TRINITY_DN4291_c0_g1~~TRINITY_DN4291_c0_g1_i3.p1  ORF type:complete len:132 (-),score=10.61 TRINITY_DN4291_c0_g1_i3:877-1272(-)